MSFLLGYDIGTSATKALLCDDGGNIIASTTAEYPLHQPEPGWSEQDPEDWWQAVVLATRHLLASRHGTEIKAIGLSGQMHGSVLLGADANAKNGTAMPLRHALLWNDQRTTLECEEISAAVGGPRAMVERVGNAALTGFTLPKLLWVRRHEPRTWAMVRHVLMPKDFIAYRLTGQMVTDVGDASGTLGFDVNKRQWHAEVLRSVGLDEQLFPQALESASVAGTLTHRAASDLGLGTASIPVVIGSGDNQAGAVGAGIVRAGTGLVILGTSGVVYAATDSPRRDLPATDPCGRLHTFCSATGANGWCMTGCMLAAGLSLRWARDLLCPGASYESVMHEAQSVPAGCEGLLFMPHLTGERCPYPDPLARGGWIGLTSRHRRPHLLRAVIEGITFTLAKILSLASDSGVELNKLRVTGGGNRSAFWRQLQADVYQRPVSTTSSEDGGGAFGAALLAGVGAGVFHDVAAACERCVREVVTASPHGQLEPQLIASMQAFDEAYPRLRGLWHA